MNRVTRLRLKVILAMFFLAIGIVWGVAIAVFIPAGISRITGKIVLAFAWLYLVSYPLASAVKEMEDYKDE